MLSSGPLPSRWTKCPLIWAPTTMPAALMPKIVPKSCGRDPVNPLKDERGPCDVGQNRAEPERHHDRIAHEGGVASRPRPSSPRSIRNPPRMPPVDRQCLGDLHEGDDEEHRPGDRQRQEDAAPGGETKDHRSDLGRDDRAETGDQHEGREKPRRSRALEQVSDDGSGDHHTGGTADTLEEAESVQHEHGRGHAAGQRGGDEEAEAHEEGSPSTLAVTDGADDQLAEGDADKASRHGELDGGRAGVEVCTDTRQCREIHVDAQGPEDRQPTDDEHKPPSLRDACMSENLTGALGVARPFPSRSRARGRPP